MQPGLSWTRNDSVNGLATNYSLSLFRNDRRSDSVTTTESFTLPADVLEQSWRDSGKVRETRQGIHATGRLEWRGDAGQSATLAPLLIYSDNGSRRDGTLEQLGGTRLVPYEQAHTDSDSTFTLLRLNGNVTQRLGDGSRVELRGGAGRARFVSHSVRSESGGATRTCWSTTRETSRTTSA